MLTSSSPLLSSEDRTNARTSFARKFTSNGVASSLLFFIVVAFATLSSTSAASLKADLSQTKTSNEEWNRLHPGFCDNMTWSTKTDYDAQNTINNIEALGGGEMNDDDEEIELSPFVRKAMALAKWRVYDEYQKKYASLPSEESSVSLEDVKRDALLGEEEEVAWEDSPVRIHSADIVVIVQRNDAEDHENFDKIRKTLPDATSDVGVTPTEWPENIGDAEWAVEPIRKLNKEFFQRGWKHPDALRNGDNLKNLPWLGIVDERNSTGGMTEEQYGGAHHIGCLFGHMHAWRTVLESNSGKKFSLIMEADGLNWQMKHLDAIVANVPEDADFVLLTNFYEAACAQPDEGGFCDKQGNTYPILAEDGPKKGQQLTGNFYYWPKDRSGAGFTRYLIGPKFQEKVYKFMARFGADMIDAFTYGHLCQDDYANAKMRDEGFAMPDGSDPFQKRETSRDEKNYGLKVLNCYLTDMHQDMIYN